MTPLKGLLNLGIGFWLSLPLLGVALWFSSGWFTAQQLNQTVKSVDNLQIKVSRPNR